MSRCAWWMKKGSRSSIRSSRRLGILRRVRLSSVAGLAAASHEGQKEKRYGAARVHDDRSNLIKSSWRNTPKGCDLPTSVKIARRSSAAPWLPVLPILGIAVWQGALGMSQFLDRGAQPYAHGTYPIRNHFAGFLEMSLPFALAYAGAALEKGNRWGPLPTGAALRAGAGFAAVALMGVGILSSLSRMGFLSCAGSVIFMGTMTLMVRLHGR